MMSPDEIMHPRYYRRGSGGGGRRRIWFKLAVILVGILLLITISISISKRRKKRNRSEVYQAQPNGSGGGGGDGGHGGDNGNGSGGGSGSGGHGDFEDDLNRDGDGDGDDNNGNGSEDDRFRVMVTMALEKEGISPRVLDQPNSYQDKAFRWLRKNAQLENYDRWQVLQRFALACFFHATDGISTIYTPNNPPGWTDDTNWLTDANECEWVGVSCSTHLKVTGISLEQNGLTGRPPPELVLLRDHLATLDLTSNSLYMENEIVDDEDVFRVFALLTNLETVLLDDNYIVTPDGIPAEMEKLTSLRKLRLSYNLLGGPLNGGLMSKWRRLTHLEIESNFLTGPIPHDVGNLEELIYVYMRRNALTIDLDFVQSGNMKNLFALWLDSNTIPGTIPTEIGTLTGLASLSLTNTTVRGPLPTEMGLLTDLRRCWLYDNKLTGTIPTEMQSLSILEVLELQGNENLRGTMPSGVCTTFAESTYPHKSLLVNCDVVSCKDCCTRCG